MQAEDLFPGYVCWLSVAEHLLTQCKTAQHGGWMEKMKFYPSISFVLILSVFLSQQFFCWMRTDLLSQYILFIVFQKLNVHIKL